MLLRWVLLFLALALIAGYFGFGGVAAEAAQLAQVLFYVFLSLFVAGVVLHMLRRAV